MASNNGITKFQVLLILIMLSAEGSFSCSSDSDCPKPNMYCYVTGVCANCTDCSVYNRLSNKGCAKNKNQCGDCVPGTEAESNLDGTLQPCSIIKTEEMDTESKSDTKYYVFIGVTILFVAIPICILIYYRRHWCCRRECFLCVKDICLFKMKNCCTNDEVDVNEKDDPLTHCAQVPSAPSASEVQGETSSPVTVKRVVVQDTTQNAIVSNNPCYVRNGHLDQQQNNEPAEYDALMNEETMASSWTPSTNDEEQQGPLNFQNALQLQQLHISQPSADTSDSGAITSTDIANTASTSTTTTTTNTTHGSPSGQNSPQQQNTSSHTSGQPISITIPNNYDNNSNSSSNYSANSSNSSVYFAINVLASPTINYNHM